MTVNFRPSDIVLEFPIPLLNTLGRLEREVAAALLIRVCQRNGDCWQPVALEAVVEAYQLDIVEGVEPLASLWGNPFAVPDFLDLIKCAFASKDDASGSIALSDLALERIAAKHRRVEGTHRACGEPEL